MKGRSLLMAKFRYPLAFCYYSKHPSKLRHKGHFSSAWDVSILAVQEDSCKPPVRGKHITEQSKWQKNSHLAVERKRGKGRHAGSTHIYTHTHDISLGLSSESFPSIQTWAFRRTLHSPLLIAITSFYACSCFVVITINR